MLKGVYAISVTIHDIPFSIKFILCEAAVSIKNQKVFICLAACYNTEYGLLFSTFVFSPIASYNLCMWFQSQFHDSFWYHQA